MSLRHLTVQVFSHGFVAFNLSVRGKWLCSTFARRFVQFGLVPNNGHYQKVAMKVFAAATEDRSEFRFHINVLEEFKEFLHTNQVDKYLVAWESIPVPPAELAEFPIKEHWVVKTEQRPVVDYLLKPLPHSKFVDLQTGKGKSFCSMYAMSHVGKRICIVVKPMYIEKWVADLLKTYEITPSEIIVVRGSSQLMALLALAKENKITAKAIIVSNKTFQNWIKAYEKNKGEIIDMGYACAPQQFFELLRVGLRLIDEVHQDFHFNTKLDLYTNIESSISLSATLLSNDPFMRRMYEMVYPSNTRFKGLALHKYVDSFAVHYRFRKPESIRTEEFGGRGYSHGAMEKSIMKNPVTLNNYFALIQQTIDNSFMRVVREKKVLVVFAASINMCTYMTQHFGRRYPDHTVKRYVEDDDQSNLFTADIVFTTLLSGGTLHDIPNLTTIILTVAVDSVQANIQSLGRLRELPDCATEFYYLVCQDIPKHLEYHNRKTVILGERAKSFRDILTGCVI